MSSDAHLTDHQYLAVNLFGWQFRPEEADATMNGDWRNCCEWMMDCPSGGIRWESEPDDSTIEQVMDKMAERGFWSTLNRSFQVADELKVWEASFGKTTIYDASTGQGITAMDALESAARKALERG